MNIRTNYYSFGWYFVGIVSLRDCNTLRGLFRLFENVNQLSRRANQNDVGISTIKRMSTKHWSNGESNDEDQDDKEISENRWSWGQSCGRFLGVSSFDASCAHLRKDLEENSPKTMKNVLNRFNESGRDHHIKESRSTPYKDKKSNDMTELAPFGTCSIAGYPERWRFARGRPHQLCLQGYSQFLQKSKAAFFPLRSCDPQPILNF